MYLGSMRSGALAALATAIVLSMALSGCGNDLGTDAGWFRKPVDLVGRNAGYSFSDLQETKLNKPITDADLIDGNGACRASAAQPQPAPSDQAGNPAAPASAPADFGEGVGLGMSECDVVGRAGQPSTCRSRRRKPRRRSRPSRRSKPPPTARPELSSFALAAAPL